MVQIPDIEGAIVSLDPMDGAIKALSGGFDFYKSKFNRTVQARRQPGSSFKPFIYSAALNKGYTAAHMINDAPVVFDDPGLEGEWRPENYSGKFFGPTRLRLALTKSRNLVSIRLLRAIGVDYALDFLERFGLDVARLPRNLSLALGSGTVTPMEMATGFAILANGGYRIEPYFIDRVVDARGEVISHADPLRVCRECDPELTQLAQTMNGELAGEALQPEFIQTASVTNDIIAAVGEEDTDDAVEDSIPSFRLAPQVVPPRNAWLMNSMLRDVVRFGTGRKAMALGRDDLAGKTGTTNDQRDAWFSGFNPTIVTTTWVGFDRLRPLGRRETGGRAALPMWMTYMAKALDGSPSVLLEQPEGLVNVRIDPATGRRASASSPDAILRNFPHRVRTRRR